MSSEKFRCFGSDDAQYAAYHDEEWGRPVKNSPDERELFERISLEAFQAGLSWLTILRKREAFRQAFYDFVPAKVAAIANREKGCLLQNRNIVRNSLKIDATINNARALLSMHARNETLAQLIAACAPQHYRRPQSLAEIPTKTQESLLLSKELKRRGFKFVGAVTCYSLMQALGVVDDHIADCWLVKQAQI